MKNGNAAHLNAAVNSWNFIADFTAISMLTTSCQSHSLYSLDSMAVKFLLIILSSKEKIFNCCIIIENSNEVRLLCISLSLSLSLSVTLLCHNVANETICGIHKISLHFVCYLLSDADINEKTIMMIIAIIVIVISQQHLLKKVYKKYPKQAKKVSSKRFPLQCWLATRQYDQTTDLPSNGSSFRFFFFHFFFVANYFRTITGQLMFVFEAQITLLSFYIAASLVCTFEIITIGLVIVAFNVAMFCYLLVVVII